MSATHLRLVLTLKVTMVNSVDPDPAHHTGFAVLSLIKFQHSSFTAAVEKIELF